MAEIIVSVEEWDRLRARVTELERALVPFAAAIAFTTRWQEDDAPVALSYAKRDDMSATGDALPMAFKVGDLRRAADVMNVPRGSIKPPAGVP